MFSADKNHKVGNSGGEEYHTLTIGEMPRHNHGYKKFNHQTYHYQCEGNIHRSPTRNDCDFIIDDNTESTGGGKAHNNMPPYLVTNCWRRIN